MDVVYIINLPKAIKKYNIENTTDLVKDDIYAKLISLNIDSKETRRTHVKAIHKTLAEKDIKVNRGMGYLFQMWRKVSIKKWQVWSI